MLDEVIEEKIKELKPQHPLLVTILENIHEMSLEDTVRVLVLSEGLEWILKVRALRLVNTREKAITDEMVERVETTSSSIRCYSRKGT